jgi:hypothetical protein
MGNQKEMYQITLMPTWLNKLWRQAYPCFTSIKSSSALDWIVIIPFYFLFLLNHLYIFQAVAQLFPMPQMII